MGLLLEQILVYGGVLLFCAVTIYYYMQSLKKKSIEIEKKVAIAKEEGVFEPISLHPYIDLDTCIGSAACVSACPEKDILGLINNKATVIRTSNCIGHGACFHSCPVEAISLRIGTETRGVDLPHVNETFETNMKGVYIAGELGGMGLIKNSVEQGQQAIENIAKNKKESKENVLDVAIIGAGPAGISAALMSKKLGLSATVLEQNSLGGTVFTFPRAKVVMTAPMNLPLYGKVKLYNTSKGELLDLWNKVIAENKLEIKENTKVENIIPLEDGTFKLVTTHGDEYISNHVLLAIGRRGSPRKLGVPGEDSQKVAYRLLEPERISGKKIIVVGGGDSAVETAILLKDDNDVILSYRKDKFARIKPRNKEQVLAAIENGSLKMIYNSNLASIKEDSVMMKVADEENPQLIKNDLVYIFAGGELPTKFLAKAGVAITKRFGYILKSYK